MAYSSSSLSSAEIAALSYGSPLWIARNALDYPSSTQSHKWHTGASGVQTDYSDSTLPTWKAHDGQPHTYTSPTDQSTGTYYLTCYLDGTQTIDCIAIQMANTSSDTLTITVRIADSFQSSTNILTVATFTSTGGDDRMLAVSLNTNTRYTNVPEIQLQITRSSGTTVPRVAQFFAGRRRTLNRAMQPGYDAHARTSYTNDFANDLSALARVQHALGFRNLEGEYIANDNSTGLQGLNDFDTIRAIYDDSLQGARMLVYVEDSSTFDNSGFPHYFEWGYINTDARLNEINYQQRQWHFVWIEVPPAVTEDLPPTTVPYSNTHSLLGTSGTVHVACGDHAVFDGATSMVVSFWFYHDSITSWSNGTWQPARKHETNQSNFRFNSLTSHRLQVFLPTGLTDTTTNATTAVSGFSPTDTWYHVVLIYDGTQSGGWGTSATSRARYAIDGTITAWSATAGTPPTALTTGSTSELKLHMGASGSGIYMDHLHIWLNVATPLNAIATELYNGGVVFDWNTSSLGTAQFAYRFDNNYNNSGSQTSATGVPNAGGGSYTFDTFIP